MSDELNTSGWNRRDFIKTSMLASGGILLAPSIGFSQSPNSEINVAIIGLGFFVPPEVGRAGRSTAARSA